MNVWEVKQVFHLMIWLLTVEQRSMHWKRNYSRKKRRWVKWQSEYTFFALYWCRKQHWLYISEEQTSSNSAQTPTLVQVMQLYLSSSFVAIILPVVDALKWHLGKVHVKSWGCIYTVHVAQILSFLTCPPIYNRCKHDCPHYVVSYAIILDWKKYIIGLI